MQTPLVALSRFKLEPKAKIFIFPKNGLCLQYTGNKAFFKLPHEAAYI